MVLTARRHEAAAPGPRRRLLAGSLLAAAVVTGGLVLLVRGGDEPGPAVPDGTVLAVPPGGEARAEHLDDGTPVFVVQARAGDAYVVAAQLDGPDPVVVGWCPRARTFEDPVARYLFDARGRPLGGRPPSGLERLPTEPAGWGRIVVTATSGTPVDDPRPIQPTGRPCLDEPHLLVVHDELVVRATD